MSNRNSGDFAENSGGGKDIKKKIVATTLPLDPELYWTHCSEDFDLVYLVIFGLLELEAKHFKRRHLF